MWTLLVVGSFSMTIQQAIVLDNSQIRISTSGAGPITIKSEGYPTEEACRNQLPKVSQMTIGPMNVHIDSAECREDDKTKAQT